MMYTRYIAIIISFTFFSCVSDEIKQEEKPPVNKFSDQQIQKIYDFIDYRKSDSISQYLTHSNDIYRAEAALAFASIQDTNYLEQLYPLLNDANSEVQKNAAWAIGQTGSESSFEPLLMELSTCDKEAEVNFLEAIGKIVTRKDSAFYENFEISNTNALGFSKSVNQLSYKRLLTAKTFDNILEAFPEIHNEDAKALFASALSRSDSRFLKDNTEIIIEIIKNETAAEVLIPLINSLGKINDEDSFEYIQSLLFDDDKVEDYRITVAKLNAYSRSDNTFWRVFSTYLSHPNENIALAATRCLKKSNFNPSYSSKKVNLSNVPRVNAKIMAYELNNKYDSRLLDDIKFEFRNAESYIDKGFYLRAIEFGKNQEAWLEDKMINSGHPLIKTVAAETLVSMSSKGKLDKSYDFKKAIISAFKTNDIGVLATLALHLSSPEMNFLGQFEDLSFIDVAIENLSLPKDIETFNELIKAKAFLRGEEPELNRVEFNHPIDWEHVKKIEKDQIITFLTNKGKISIQLKVEDAPSSVSNFIKLAEEGFYDNKFFHRVVPNFVVQTGCYRGDGYGSVDYSIRSEFALHEYSTGAVGMASAGKDTESCQWFVTHNPTPFLEGRYTIFGYVIDEDLITLHQISQGDQIISVKVK